MLGEPCGTPLFSVGTPPCLALDMSHRKEGIKQFHVVPWRQSPNRDKIRPSTK
jgi:hypothetical protein